MIRYTGVGKPDATFVNAGKVFTSILPNQRDEHASAIEIYANRIYLAGYSNNSFCMAAYVKDGIPLPLTFLNSFG